MSELSFDQPSQSPATTYRVLDAGCGSGHEIIDIPRGAHVVGIDNSAQALSRNELVDEKIVGDLQSYPLPPASFDEVLCWDVLEHLPQPDRAFRNMAQSLKPGGRMTIGVPNVLAAKGLITKFTPHWFHVWVYRRYFPNNKNAGKPGYGPWPTFLRFSIAPRGLRKMAREEGLEVERLRIYEGRPLKPFWDRHRLIRWACRVIWPFSDPRLTEVEFVARRKDRV